ncbi:conserved hypothetical protein [Candidatus Terasakiella magnetica]|nr:conserved hypothetical protein [Candidatus Terasakiella magnetica]
MAVAQKFECALNDPAAEATFRSFTAAILGEAGHGRHAVLVKSPDGPRCLLQNSGRCLSADTPWRMTRDVVEPVFRFDDSVEWVALFPIDDWQMRMDAALQASFTSDRPWARMLADELLAELDSVQRLIITR